MNEVYQEMPSKQDGIDGAVLVAALDALVPSERQRKIAAFRVAHPAIERALERGVPQKTIVEELSRNGFKLSLGGFKALLSEMREECARAVGAVTDAQIDAGSNAFDSGIAENEAQANQTDQPAATGDITPIALMRGVDKARESRQTM